MPFKVCIWVWKPLPGRLTGARLPLPFRAPALPLEKVVDPTGAGDSFAGGLAGYIARMGDLHHHTRPLVETSVVVRAHVEDAVRAGQIFRVFERDTQCFTELRRTRLALLQRDRNCMLQK